jgi:hypothetical protein
VNKRHLALLALPFALFAIACGSGATSSGGSKPVATVNANGGKDAAAGKVGAPIRDGKFEFTVQTIKCGVSKVGDDMLNKTAQGQFCLVTLKVANIGKEAQTFDGSNQKAYGADGAQFSADDTAGIYANDNDDAFLNDINPGNSVTGTVVFDIPKTAKLAKLELHDSAFSGGVTVAVQ